MKKFKKLISLLMVLTFMFSMVLPAAGASLSEILDDYEDAIDTVSILYEIKDNLDENDKAVLENAGGVVTNNLVVNVLNDPEININGTLKGVSQAEVAGLIEIFATIPYLKTDALVALVDEVDVVKNMLGDGQVYNGREINVTTADCISFFSNVLNTTVYNLSQDAGSLVGSDYDTAIRPIVKDAVTEALREVVNSFTLDDGTAVAGLLTHFSGINTEQIIMAIETISDEIDTANNGLATQAEKIVAKGYLRCKTKLLVNGNVDSDAQISVKKGSSKTLGLEVLEQELINPHELIWVSDKDLVSFNNNVMTASSTDTGTANVKVYRNAANQVADQYMFKFTVTVTSSSGGGGGGGTPTPSDDSQKANDDAKDAAKDVAQQIETGNMTTDEAVNKVSEVVSKLKDVEVTQETKAEIQKAVTKIIEKAGAVSESDVQAAVSDKSASVSVAADVISKKIAEVASAAEKLTTQMKDGGLADVAADVKKVVVVEVPKTAAKDDVAVQLPAKAMKELQTAQAELVVKTPQVNFAIPPAAISVAASETAVVKIESKVVTSEVAAKAAEQASETETVTPAGNVVELTISVVDEGTGDAQSVTTFTKKVRVALSYAPAKVKDPEILSVWTAKDENSPWEPVADPTIKINRETNTVEVGTNHLSLYAVMEYNKTFKDIVGHWAKRDIEVMAAKHVAKGMTKDTFAPDANVTRAQFAALLVRALGLEENAAAAGVFKDIPSDSWYAGAVGAAYQAGIVKGISAESFAPEQNITREQMSAMIARTLDKNINAEEIADQLKGFADAGSISEWAKDGVALMVKEGIVKGRTLTEFVPAGTATRAEATVMLRRILDN